MSINAFNLKHDPSFNIKDDNTSSILMTQLEDKMYVVIGKLGKLKKTLAKEQKANKDLYLQSVEEKKRKIEAKFDTQIDRIEKKIAYFEDTKKETMEKTYSGDSFETNPQFIEEKMRLEEDCAAEIKLLTAQCKEKLVHKLRKLELSYSKKDSAVEEKTTKYMAYLESERTRCIEEKDGIIAKKDEALSAFTTIPKSRIEIKLEEDIIKAEEDVKKATKEFEFSKQDFIDERKRASERAIMEKKRKEEEALEKKKRDDEAFAEMCRRDSEQREADRREYWAKQGIEYDPLNPPKVEQEDYKITVKKLFAAQMTEKEREAENKWISNQSKIKGLKASFKEKFPTVDCVMAYYSKDGRIILTVEDKKETVLYSEWFETEKLYKIKYDFLHIQDYNEDYSDIYEQCVSTKK